MYDVAKNRALQAKATRRLQLTITHESADIVIVGSGASGAAAAWRLSFAGFKIVCLEQGRWIKPEEYPNAAEDWETQSRGTWAFDPNVRGWDVDYPLNVEESCIDPLMFNAVGGSTIHYTAHVPRFHPSDFSVKTLDAVADDWPIDYDELEPYYDLNDELMGCSGINGDPANPPRKERLMPPLPLGSDGERMAGAFDRLGWHWWPSDNYVNSVPYRGRAACNNCGNTGLGCSRQAKGSTDVTYWPEAIKNGVELRTGARVFRVDTADNGEATGVSYFDGDGEVNFQPARAVILAMNGVGTPRIMLNSSSESHPGGLCNSSGLVGKNLMFHPYAMVTGFFNDGMLTYKGALANIIMCQEFYETNQQKDFVRGYSYQMVRSSGPVTTAAGLMTAGVPWGEKHHGAFTARFGNSTILAVIGEDLPEEHNRVELDPKLTDANGIPAPKIFYKLSENSRRLLDDAIANAETALKEAGAFETLANPLLRSSGWHLMGTARMGDDPNASVVDRWGQAHGAENIFVIDGSVFVTCAAVNPTPTIGALALRTADYIKRERSDLKS